ncbi:Disease resistance protein RPM1 [Panicum miliaceum]|uniref:Disease resistance protein RPM1 n=1 Tax=Panicum miliaceum TaxID=4540 RepID=A0A3L6RAW0_PANMI|nr:Disease resistance protein RPM1 [Panicum miliaceum]
MGGIGKTTLVADVYQSQELNDKFTKRAFVTVLRPFKLQELLRSIATQLDAVSSGKKEWDAIAEAFSKIKKASWTVVITTRQKDIAEHCCKKPECIHMLDILEAKEAQKLFIKMVFKKTIDLNNEYPELVEPAKLIINKCDGLPLAIVTIGSFLAGQETISAMEWRRLDEHITAELEMNPKMELIRAVLMKSYDGLPYYLKPCFLYMSIFPEDCNISRRRLVRRWAVEGYSSEARGKSCMEIADSYFEELIGRSMVLPTRESITSKQKADSCKLHDLIRDIGISMSTKEDLVFRLEEGCSSNTHGIVRYLAISSNWEGDEGEFQSIVELSCIRSLTMFGKCKPFYISDKMRFLRVLDLDTVDLANHCLEHIGKFLHLRYLSLRMCFGIFCLPDSVGNLSQLEVLDIKWTEIQVLPKTIVRLRKLRYLHAGSGGFCSGTSGLSYPDRCVELLKVQRDAYFGKFRKVYARRRSRRDWCAIACCAALPPIMMGMEFPGNHGVTVPRGMRKLKSLHTLRSVHLAWGNAVLEETKGLTSLRKLGVVGISEKNCHNLCLAISKLSLLESLSLSSGLDFSVILSGMEPPPGNLQSLKLYGETAKLPEWIKGLQNLVKLGLYGTRLSRDGAAMLMQDIGKLRNLSILSLAEYSFSGITIGELHFKSGIFTSLKVLDLCYAPSTEFKSV